jgi:dephospho-CoA kinase
MILGITGVSGSGKHTAANFLAKRGWTILDADSIAHYLYRPYTSVWKAIVDEFGERVLNQDDSINRVQLSKIVFNTSEPERSQESIRRLNDLVHPYIRRRLDDEIRHFARKGGDIAVVAALWKELEMEKICEKILWVRADPEKAMDRIRKRDGISAEVYALRVKSQIPPSKTDWVVENNGAPEELASKIVAALGL